MKAREYEGWTAGEHVVEPKLDGYRLCTVVSGGAVTFHCGSAEQPEWAENLGHVAEALLSLDLDGVMFDGEIMAATWNRT
jgi:ATP-dependent DNA ligase